MQENTEKTGIGSVAQRLEQGTHNPVERIDNSRKSEFPGNSPVAKTAQVPNSRQKCSQLNTVCACLHCGGSFVVKTSSLKRGRGRFCKRPCFHAWMRAHPVIHLNSFTPPSTREERVRAHGLINKRLKLGHIEKPESCEWCGKVCRTEAHHPDYSQPDLVVWLCRSDHMKAHRNREFEKAVALKAHHARRLYRKVVRGRK